MPLLCGEEEKMNLKPDPRKVLDIIKKAEQPEFKQLYEGDGLEILPESKEFNFKCCNCGFIHKVKIEHTGSSVILRFYEAV